MGLFDKIFGNRGEQAQSATEGYVIDIRDDCFVVNGQRLEVPMHIDALAKALGKPRAKHFKTKESDREITERIAGEPITDRVNYFWDELGLKAYTYNGSVVNTFGIQFTKADYETKNIGTKAKFKGTVTINGQPWLSAAMAGRDKEVFREFNVGNYLITAEYTDFEQDDATRDETSFTGLEIQLKK